MSRPPITVRGLDHVVLRCSDITSMLAFYQDVLGLELVRVNEPLALYHLRAGSGLIDLVAVGGPLGGDTAPTPERANMAHVCLRLEAPEWDELLSYLEASGLSPGQPQHRFGADGHGPSIYITDPEGNVVELKGQPD